jgi:hypothetical protein
MNGWLQAAIALGVFAVVTGLSLALGAANLGTALGIAQIPFAAVVMALLLRR